MSNENLIKKNLKNAEGKRLYKKTLLEYSREIIENLNESPEKLPELLDLLEVTEEDFYAYLSGDKTGNIALYDQALSHLVKKKTNNPPKTL